jgi:phosphate transport system substrate-binding protein
MMKKWLNLVLVAGLAVLLTLSLVGCGGGGETEIVVGGSTTIQPLAEKLADAFESENPEIEIDVQGGGSSTGVKSCNNGMFDIGMASRDLKPDEPELKIHLLARDGIAIVVHPSNSISGLTKEQVKDIFAGNIRDWSEVGGTSGKIEVVAREEGSGTLECFKEMVMKETNIAAGASRLPSNGAVRHSVATSPKAIGFISLGYIDKTVKALSIDGIEPTEDNCKSGDYSLVRPLYLLTKEEPKGAVKDFLDFCLSDKGQKIVEEEGYISIS